MKKQCGNCWFWLIDLDKSIHTDSEIGDCEYPLPELPESIILDDQESMFDTDGENCPVYKENS